MARVLARDLTPHSMTKNKQIILPVSIIECPPMKIFSIRLYKNDNVATEIIAENLDKEVKRRLKLPKKQIKKIDEIEKELQNYDDIRIIIFTLAKRTAIKKTPDITEIALNGSIQEKFNTAKQLLGKEISVSDVFSKNQLIDIRAVTKGKGIQGPVKRFGIGLRQHKSEKGVRKAGSLGPWKPARVTFRAHLMGQMGFFTRVQYNSRILDIVNASDINPKSGFQNYGITKNNCIIVKGSIQGPSKRAILMTLPLRPNVTISKENFEIVSRLK
jgi:large subunit ribosomal protein L3